MPGLVKLPAMLELLVPELRSTPLNSGVQAPGVGSPKAETMGSTTAARTNHFRNVTERRVHAASTKDPSGRGAPACSRLMALDDPRRASVESERQSRLEAGAPLRVRVTLH